VTFDANHRRRVAEVKEIRLAGIGHFELGDELITLDPLDDP
jgi:hypothetical protein